MVRRACTAVAWLGGLALYAMSLLPVVNAATVMSVSAEPVLAPNGCAVAVRYRWTIVDAVEGQDGSIMVHESLPLLAADWLERLEQLSFLARPRIDGRTVALSEPSDVVAAREGTSLVLTFSVELPQPVAPARLAVDLRALGGGIPASRQRATHARPHPADTTGPPCL